MDGSAPIRGGIPIAFPQFADEGPMKLHGFARESLWKIVGQTDNDSCLLELTQSESTKELWPFDFRLQYQVKLLPRGLQMQLSVKNTDQKDFSFTGCFHTYFRFEKTSSIELHGLDGTPYVDKADSRKEKVQDGTINAEKEANRSAQEAGVEHGFVDRIYLNSGNEYKFVEGTKTLYTIEHSPNWTDTTIYNPWLGDKQGDKGPDFDDDGYQFTICCEPTLSARNAVTVKPGDTWEASQTIRVPE